MMSYGRNLGIKEGSLIKTSAQHPVLVKTGKRETSNKMLLKEYVKYCEDLLPNKWQKFVFSIGHCHSKIHHRTKKVLRRLLRNHLKVLEKLSCETEKETISTVCLGKIRKSMTNACKLISAIQKVLKKLLFF